MKERGHTLAETTVVLGIISILLALAIPRFADYLKRSRSESQTRTIYAELLRSRARAVYQRRETRMKFFAGRFEIYSSAAEGSGVAPIARQALYYPIDMNGTGVNVDFDTRGMALNLRSICIAGQEETGAVDSVVIGHTRVSIGKKNLQKKDHNWDCEAANITIR